MSGRLLVRWAIGLAIVGALVVTLDPSAVGAQLATADVRLVAAGVLGLTAVHLLGAVAWRVLTSRLVGLRLPWGQAVRTYYAAQAIGGLTPANLGSDAFRMVALRGTVVGSRQALLPIVVQRVTSYLALSLIAAVALLAASRPAGLMVGMIIGAIAASAVAIVVLSLVSAAGGPFGALRERLLGPLTIGRRTLAGSVAIGLGLGVAFHAAGVLLTWVIVLAVEPQAASSAGLAAVALARLSLVVPMTPSGLGIQEAALAGLFVGLGLPPESAIAAGLLARLALVLTTVIGAVGWVSPTHSKASSEPRESADQPTSA